MALVNGSEYYHIDLHPVAGGDVIRHMLKDAQARADVTDLKSAFQQSTMMYRKYASGITDIIIDTTWTNGYTFLDDGTLIEREAYHYSDYIPVTDGEYSIFAKNGKNNEGILRVIGYDINKANAELVAKCTTLANSDFTKWTFTVDGVKYIRVSYYITERIFVYDSAVALTDMISNAGAMIIGMKHDTETAISAIQKPVELEIQQGYYTKPNTYVPSRNNVCCTKIYLALENSKITVGPTSSGILTRIAYWDVDNQDAAILYPSSYTDNEIEFTIPFDAYISIFFMKSSGDIVPSNVDREVMVYSKIVRAIDKLQGMSRWDGKKIVFFGDSRTWYDGHVYGENTKADIRGTTCIGYQQQCVKLLGITAVNQGVSGESSEEICERIRAFDFTGYDAVFIEGGINDFIHANQVTIGTLEPIGSTFDTNTVYGAWQSAIEYLMANYPLVKIYIDITAIAWSGNDIYPYTTAEIKKNVAELYNLPCLDLYKNAGITVVNRDAFYCDDVSLTSWRLHFNNEGNKLLGQIIAEFINTH